MKISWRWAGSIAAAAALAVGVNGIAQAQAPVTLTFAVTENRVPGAAGQATVTSVGNNQLRVDIRLTGLPPNGEHAAHFHTASNARCDTNDPVTYPLTNVRVDGSGVGTSTSTITVRAEAPLTSGNAYLNVHQAASPPGQGVVCANVTANLQGLASGTGAAGGQTPTTAPRTGTGLMAEGATVGMTLAGLAAIVVLLGSTGALAYARRR